MKIKKNANDHINLTNKTICPLVFYKTLFNIFKINCGWAQTCLWSRWKYIIIVISSLSVKAIYVLWCLSVPILLSFHLSSCNIHLITTQFNTSHLIFSPSMIENKHWQEKWHVVFTSAQCNAAKWWEDLWKVKQGAYVSVWLVFPDGHVEGAVWSEI